jgi:hypothetical protein
MRSGRVSAGLVAFAVVTFVAAGSPTPAVQQAAARAHAPSSGAGPVVRSVDLVAYQSTRAGEWFSVPIASLPRTTSKAQVTFTIQGAPVANRRSGTISPTLVSSYVFLQFGEVTPAAFEAHAATVGALFIRSSLMSFVDYSAGRVLGWDRRSVEIPTDVRGLIRSCNQRRIPVFLELNYSDYVPGPPGTGVESLARADNIGRTIAYLAALGAEGLAVEGVTFGDEIEDDAGFGNLKPTLRNSNLVGRFVAYAKALKARFPSLRIYAFDSFIGAARGAVSTYWELLRRIRAEEVAAGMPLLDGFAFRESYVYMDGNGRVQPSQLVLDDTESLYRNTEIYRYDVDGRRRGADRDYLHTLITMTKLIFGRTIAIGLTEYLPAGPVQISESDTAPYADRDFIVHYADVIGIYANLGLDVVSSYMFADSTQQAEAYLDRSGRRGANYPVRDQLARSFRGEILAVTRSIPYGKVRVKVYPARSGAGHFVLVLNKDVAHERTVRVRLAGSFDLTLRLPPRSYTALSDGPTGMTVSGIGN